MDNAHSVLPPSGAGFWGSDDGCTNWVMMNQMYPETEQSEDSKQGTAAHDLATDMIDAFRVGNSTLDRGYYVGSTSPNGVIISDEIFDSAEIYARDVLSVMTKTGVFGGECLGIEKRIPIKAIHELCDGTPDCYIFDSNNSHLHLWDFKHGHDTVEAFENWQGIAYVSGLLDEFGINGWLDQETLVTIHIVQPRAYHRKGVIREWNVTASSLRGYINTMKMNAEKALSEKSTYRTGEQCYHCPGRHNCDVALKQGVKLYQLTSETTTIGDEDKNALGMKLLLVEKALKHLKGLKSGYSARIESDILMGVPVPYWDMSPGRGSVEWVKPYAEIVTLGELFGVNLKKEVLKTPTQAKALGLDESLLGNFSEKKPGKLQLTQSEDNVSLIFKE